MLSQNCQMYLLEMLNQLKKKGIKAKYYATIWKQLLSKKVTNLITKSKNSVLALLNSKLRSITDEMLNRLCVLSLTLTYNEYNET